jgi:hypothetical protein
MKRRRVVPAGDSRAAVRKSRLWLWFVAAFAVQFAAWGWWLTLASRHRVQEVPVVRMR